MGLPLDATGWEQIPFVVRQVVFHLLAVIQPQAVRIAALDARWQQRSSHAGRPPRPIRRLSSRPLALAGKAPWASPGAGDAMEVIDVKPQACSCGQTERPDTRPYHTHEVIELPEIQMTVNLLFLKILLPEGVLVVDARGSWQVPHPWSLWQALMPPEDRVSCRREDLHTVVAERQG